MALIAHRRSKAAIEARGLDYRAWLRAVGKLGGQASAAARAKRDMPARLRELLRRSGTHNPW